MIPYRVRRCVLIVLLPLLVQCLTFAASPCSCLLVSLAASSCSISELLSDTAASRALRSSSSRL